MNEYLIIKGKQEVEGAINIQGSKNASLPLICASMLVKGKVKLHHVPHIKDVYDLLDILKYLDCKIDFFKDTLEIDSSSIKYIPLLIDEVKRIRASYYLIPVLLYFENQIDIDYPGGCKFQERPIDIHLDIFNNAGIKIIEGNHLHLEKEELSPLNITLKKKSLGASINALLLASFIEGESIVSNISNDDELNDVIDFINEIGGKVKKQDNTLYIEGVKKFFSTSFYVQRDRVEIASFAFLGAALGRVLLVDVDKDRNKSLFDLMDQLNIKYSYSNSLLCVEKMEKLDKEIDISCDDSSSISSDLKCMLSAFFLLNQNKSHICDKVYPLRNQYVQEFKNFGAKISSNNENIEINPSYFLNGTEATVYDLRMAMGLLLCALLSKGKSVIHNMGIIKRGHENIYKRLRMLNIEFEVGKE